MIRQETERIGMAGYRATLLDEGRKFSSGRPGQRPNLGVDLRGSGVMVVDLDSETAIRWARENGIESPAISQTRRGVHLFMRHAIENPTNRINYRGLDVDILFN